jgi:hypothetical protein
MLGQEVYRQDGQGSGLGLLRQQQPALRPLQVVVQPMPPQQPSSAPRARVCCVASLSCLLVCTHVHGDKFGGVIW